MVQDGFRDNHKKWNEFSSLKSLQIVIALMNSDQPLGISTISEVTGIAVATCHRILQELAQCDFVERVGDKKLYRIGVASWSMAINIKDSYYLNEMAKDEMERLNDLSGETIHLIKQEGYQGIYLSKLDAKNHIGLKSRVGTKIPLYSTSAGKIMLSGQEEDWLNKYFSSVELERTSPNTICDEDELRRELKTIKIRGYALDNRERHPDIICVAAPVFNASGKVSCVLSISAPDYRMSLDKATSLIKEVQKSAAIVSKKIGGTFPISLNA